MNGWANRTLFNLNDSPSKSRFRETGTKVWEACTAPADSVGANALQFLCLSVHHLSKSHVFSVEVYAAFELPYNIVVVVLQLIQFKLQAVLDRTTFSWHFWIDILIRLTILVSTLTLDPTMKWLRFQVMMFWLTTQLVPVVSLRTACNY